MIIYTFMPAMADVICGRVTRPTEFTGGNPRRWLRNCLARWIFLSGEQPLPRDLSLLRVTLSSEVPRMEASPVSAPAPWAADLARQGGAMTWIIGVDDIALIAVNEDGTRVGCTATPSDSGRRAGSATSRAKSNAARVNGKLGGRPQRDN